LRVRTTAKGRTQQPAETDRKVLAAQVIEGLHQAYPDASCELKFSNPLELLVATILSAQCTDQRVNMVTDDLFKRYRSAADYAAVPQTVLEEEIHSTGFFRQKALSIRRMAEMLAERFGGQVPKKMEEMTQLPGVARKTANVVLGSAYGIASGITVDTHVRRLAYRIGLSDETDPDKIERDLMALVPQDKWVWFGHAMIWHGRRVCAARSPACSACVLNDVCPKRGIGSPGGRMARSTPGRSA
jgi:endonuclease-3